MIQHLLFCRHVSSRPTSFCENFCFANLSRSTKLTSWDTGYIFSRPHSFAGGKWHWLWKPYALYGDIDYIYSKTQYELKNGFTAAQGEIALRVLDREEAHFTHQPLLISILSCRQVQ